MIDCEKCREMISCLLDGELSQAEQSLVREHIASCPECRSVYDAFSAVSEQMHEEEPLPEGLHEKIMSGIKAKPKKKNGIVWIKYLSVAACLALVIFAGAKSGMFGPAETKSIQSNCMLKRRCLFWTGDSPDKPAMVTKQHILWLRIRKQELLSRRRQLKSSAHCLRRQKMRTANMSCRARPITRSSFDDGASLILCSFILMTAAPMPITETELLPPQVRRRRYAICSMHAQGNKK